MPWWICPFAGCFPLLFFKFIKLKQRSQQIAFLRGSKPFQNQYQKQDMLMLCKHCMLNVHRFVTFRKPLLHISLQFTQFYQSCFLLHCHATCTFAFLDAFVIPASDAGVCVCSFPAKNASKYFEAKVWHLRAPFPPLRLFSVLVHLLSIQKGTNWSIDARCVWPPPPECHPLQNKIQTLPDKCATSSHVNTAANDFALVLYSFCFPTWGGGGKLSDHVDVQIPTMNCSQITPNLQFLFVRTPTSLLEVNSTHIFVSQRQPTTQVNHNRRFQHTLATGWEYSESRSLCPPVFLNGPRCWEVSSPGSSKSHFVRSKGCHKTTENGLYR